MGTAFFESARKIDLISLEDAQRRESPPLRGKEGMQEKRTRGKRSYQRTMATSAAELSKIVARFDGNRRKRAPGRRLDRLRIRYRKTDGAVEVGFRQMPGQTPPCSPSIFG